MTATPRAHAKLRRTLLVLAACLVAALAGALLARRIAGPDAAPVTEAASVFPAPRPLPAFALGADDGARFDRARLLGHYTFLFFGYANCPDLCPTTLAELARAERLLKDLPAAQRPAVVFISVDAARDAPENLARYVQHFDRSFVGVTGPDEAIAPLAAALGVAYQRGTPTDGGYAVDHTAALFLIDPEARLLAVFGTPHVAGTIAGDYRRIVAGRGRA